MPAYLLVPPMGLDVSFLPIEPLPLAPEPVLEPLLEPLVLEPVLDPVLLGLLEPDAPLCWPAFHSSRLRLPSWFLSSLSN